MKLSCRKIGINGEGIGYIDHKPVFCDGLLPGESAEVEIIEQKNTYARAKLTKITWFSKDRVRTIYPYYLEEGCPLMILKYEKQLEYKRQLLCEAIYKYAGVRSHFVRDIRPSASTIGYRSQCKLPVQESHKLVTTGMYVPGTNHYHPIDSSIIHSPQLEEIRKQVLVYVNNAHLRDYDPKLQKGLRYLVIRAIDGKSQCTFVTGKTQIPQRMIDDIMSIPGMSGVLQSINTDPRTPEIFGSSLQKLAGEDTMAVSMAGITIALSPESFFQLNVEQAEKMYETAVSKIDPCETLVEAYCGVGVMSLMASGKARQVIGIESVPKAIRNAKANAEANHIDNCQFWCMDAAEGLYKAAAKAPVDTLLVDPPRSGMSDKMIEAILKVKPKKIIYISCSPSTLGKNLNDLKHQYHPVTIIPFDLFPHTPHVESITVLEIDNYQ